MAEWQAQAEHEQTGGAEPGSDAGKPTVGGSTSGMRGPRARSTRADRGGEAREPRDASALTLHSIPVLRNPILLMAFEGWNDAGEAASTAAQVVRSQLDGDRFATIDPEEFFVFTERRPHVRLTRRGRRRIEWPSNEFFACLHPSDDPEVHDLIVLLGTEPDLRWRAFGDLVMDVARRTGVGLVVAVGAYFEDIPHTVPPRVNSYAVNGQLHPLLKDQEFGTAKYEGPTGIITVLTNRFAEAGFPVVNFWGRAPHYITANPNPVVAARILREVARVLHLSIDMDLLDEAATRFSEQVQDAVSKDPEAMAYVQELERQYEETDEDDEEDEDAPRTKGGELPSGAAVVEALEAFLRQRRHPPSQGS
jgi:proteasome assembly chaperone (PAC2) family protein